MMSGVSQFGWKVKFDHVFPEKWGNNHRPSFSQLTLLLPMVLRYFVYWVYCKLTGKSPIMEYITPPNGKQMYGVPIGGIGGGSIGRGFRGEFCRFQLKPGIYEYQTIPADTFIVTIKEENGTTLYQSRLSPTVPEDSALSTWQYNINESNAEYTGLYPRAWYVYRIPEQNVVLTCQQVSPVIPHNYKDSSIPGAVFIWQVENNSVQTKIVSLTFTFESGIGEKDDNCAGCTTEDFTNEDTTGVLIHRSVDDVACSFAVATRKSSTNNVTKLLSWDPTGDGSEVWNPLFQNGGFGQAKTSLLGEKLGCAVCAQTTLDGNSSNIIEFSLVWNIPQVYFGERNKSYKKYYTKYFQDVSDLSHYCLTNYDKWNLLINDWQDDVLNDSLLPEWYKSCLFNETYFITDGGSVWLLYDDVNSLPTDDCRREYGMFAYLEGHEYRMYNTYDVHFYASFALAKLWPYIQKTIQLDFNDTVDKEDTTQLWHWFDGKVTNRKVLNTVPHDLGDPAEEPFLKINSYPVHDVSEWRDLNLKFVLQCYRDYVLTKDLKQVELMWSNIVLLMDRSLRWDTDQDGVIENGGTPDQTYDVWTMDGMSAYCGSLWLASLQCTCNMALLMNDQTTFDKFSNILEKGKLSWEEKLWNGSYYNFDSSQNTWSKSIMSDQLCGLWYLHCCGVNNQVFREDYVKKGLDTIYNYNVLKFRNGTSGAVNGMMPDGTIDRTAMQSEEAWPGVIYALASLMIFEGMTEQAFKTAEGIYNTVYNIIGMGFETPEGIYEEKSYRSIGYMRPLSVWAIQHAWEMKKKKLN